MFKRVLSVILIICMTTMLFGCGGGMKAEVGQTVKYGKDEKGDIEWLVLDIQFDKALLISQRALANTSTLGNNELDLTPIYDKCFTNKEKEKIQSTSILYKVDNWSGNQRGNSSSKSNQSMEEVKLFILDDAMCDKFMNTENYKCEPYSDKMEHFYYMGTKTYLVWTNMAASGKQGECSKKISYSEGKNNPKANLGIFGIRPAMWVSIK